MNTRDGKIYMRKYIDGTDGNDTIIDPVSVAANEDHTHTEEIQDVVGAMFTGNTETNVTVTYQDDDGTIDVVGDAATRTICRVIGRGSLPGAYVDCDVNDTILTITGRAGDVSVRKVSLPVQVLPQVTYR